MGLKMHEKKSISREYSKRYTRSNKGDKSILLDEFKRLTGYRRDYASFLLRNWGKRVYFSGGRVVVIGDFVKRRSGSGRKKKYAGSELSVLIQFWELLNYPCGKRLKEEIAPLLVKAGEFGELNITSDTSSKLLEMSSSTIDRLLSPARKKYELKCRARTKPGSLLKRNIQIRTGVDWDEDEPGFMEIDLVSHDGGNVTGDFCQTLNCVDIKSRWVEFACVRNKAQSWVFEALVGIRGELPFPLRGIDSDNGSEFINNPLYKYCKDNGIIFTRSRPYRKNDNCFVEQKNYTAIRNNVGYYRYDTVEQMDVLNELYSHLRLFINYFQPTMKLIEKYRIRSKIIKKYDKPKTPYQRLLEIDKISDLKKKELMEIYRNLNPFELKRNIHRLRDKVEKMSYLRKKGVS